MEYYNLLKGESFNQKVMLDIFEKMCSIRNFEKQVKKAYDEQDILCPVYLSIGQEAISASVSSSFNPNLIFTQHRAHSTYIAFGGNKDKLVEELLGRDGGCTKGKGGSPGVQDFEIGMFGHHGLIGENVPLAVGAALGAKNKSVLCVFGDGAAEEDYVFTAMAFAATNKLPILFICEDNDLSILTKKSERRNWELTDALRAVGMPCEDICDDPELIISTVNNLKTNLPAFINCRTCRHRWHVGTGQDGSPHEDRLEIFEEGLLKRGISQSEIFKIQEKTKIEMEELWKKHLQKQ